MMHLGRNRACWRKLMLCAVFIGLIASAASTPDASAAAKSVKPLSPEQFKFCAKKYDPNNTVINLFLKLAPSNRDAKNFTPALWPTLTIPVYLDETIEKERSLKESTLKVLKYMNSMSPTRFAVCDYDTIKTKTNIESAIIISSTPASECSLIGMPCTSSAGFTQRPKSAPKLQLVKDRRRNWDFGPSVRIASPHFDEGGLVHELLHALGMLHPFQTPAAKGIVTVVGRGLNFDSGSSFHLEAFDPASIMNYAFYQKGLGGNIRYVCNKNEIKTGSIYIGDCAIDRLLKDNKTCFYQGANCFERLDSYLNDSEPGSLAIGLEGQTACLAVSDQAWLVSSSYAAGAVDDKFGIKSLIPGGGCRWP
jgi:hypothetical protein